MRLSYPFAVIAVFLAAALGTSNAASQTTIYVPADQPTIQAGINAAANVSLTLETEQVPDFYAQNQPPAAPNSPLPITHNLSITLIVTP